MFGVRGGFFARTRRELYRLFACKPSTIKALIAEGVLVEGKVLQTRITPDGLEQDILIKPVSTLEFINITIEPGKLGIEP